MRRLVTLGLISAAAACTVACGDDDPTPSPPNGGSAGRGNDGGSAGAANGGSAGTTGGTSNPGNGGTSSAGSAGAAGDGGSAGDGSSGDGGTGGGDGDPDAGDGGGGPPCTGCVELRVPVTGATKGNESTTFQFGINAADFTNGIITWRVRAPVLSDQLFVQMFSTDGSGFSFDGEFHLLNVGNGFLNDDQFFDIAYNLAVKPPVDREVVADAGADAGPGAPIAADHDKSLIIAFGLQVGALASLTGATTVTLLVDSVTFTGVAGDVVDDVDFAASASGFSINTFVPLQPDSVVIHHPE